MPDEPTTPTEDIPEGDGIFGLHEDPDSAAVTLIPVPYDATTSYRPGTRFGPEAIRRASCQIDLHDARFGDVWRAGIAMEPIDPDLLKLSERVRPAAERIMLAADGGSAEDRRVLDEAGDHVNAFVAERTRRVIRAGRVPGVIGGEHSVPYAAIGACAQTGPIGVLHIDAHWDLRPAYLGMHWSHASIIHNAMRDVDHITRLVSVGVRDASLEEWNASRALGGRLRAFTGRDLADASFTGKPWDETCAEIVAALPERVYITFDIDGLEPALCPNTGTPVPGGLSFEQVSRLLEHIARSGKRLVGFDLVEVAPGPGFPEAPDGIDAIVGARALYRLIGAATAGMRNA
ncbi:MAG: agmatinase family protein [Planctomycetota bacterium]